MRTRLMLSVVILMGVGLFLDSFSGPLAEAQTDVTSCSPAGVAPGNSFQIALDVSGQQGFSFSSFTFSRLPVSDLEARADGVRGSSKWADGDRLGYETGWSCFLHEDPGFHAFIPAFRFMIQVYGDTAAISGVRVNDKGMAESKDGFSGPPYPYEPNVSVPIDRRWPGGTLLLYHARPKSEGGKQLLRKFVIPAISPTDPNTRCFYQLGGLIVCEDGSRGTISRIIFASLDRSYTFTEERFD